MSKQHNLKPFALAFGAVLTAGLALPAANAGDNPFGVTSLSSGYMVAEKGEGKCGEGKCGESKGQLQDQETGKKGEGKCGEGKCGK